MIDCFEDSNGKLCYEEATHAIVFETELNDYDFKQDTDFSSIHDIYKKIFTDHHCFKDQYDDTDENRRMTFYFFIPKKHQESVQDNKARFREHLADLDRFDQIKK